MLTAAAALVAHEQALIKRVIGRELAFLTEQKQLAAEMGIKSGPALQSMAFREMRQRQPVFYASSEPNYDELISRLVVSHNRQYQWLLAEAFELFENFLLDAYGCAAAEDSKTWRTQDLKKIGPHAGQSAAWWVTQARELQHPPPPKVVLERLRQLPGVREIEVKNAHGVDYKIVLLMIERMRHVIVHNRGQVTSKEDFTQAILTNAGLLSGSLPKPEDAAFIGQYFGNCERWSGTASIRW